MKIRTIVVDRINPAPYNPRKDLRPGDPEYENLKRSIESYGYVEPLVWNERTGHLVGGHQRFKVLVTGGAEKLQVSVVDLPLEREKALNIALNKISGAWDEQKLAQLLEELTSMPDFEVELTGFDAIEAQELITEVLHAPGDQEEDFDVDAALDTTEPAITKPGEIIELGGPQGHRLMCGDSSNAEHVKELLGGDRIHLLHCDPPYNVNYYGGDRPIPESARPKQSRSWDRIYGDNLTQGEYSAWLGKVFTNVGETLHPGGCFYIWNGHRQFGPMHELLSTMGFKVSCVITWAKETFAIGYGDYNQQTEFCLYGWKEDNGAHQWYGPTNESTLWQIRRDPTKSYQHPTQKPLEVAERAIRNSTRPNQIVMDTFLGSGTTLIAAERIGRRCVGLEISPHYCDVIVRRFIAFAGERSVPSDLLKRYGQPTPPAITKLASPRKRGAA